MTAEMASVAGSLGWLVALAMIGVAAWIHREKVKKAVAAVKSAFKE